MESGAHDINRQLFARIAEGDEQAFRQVFHAYNRILFPFITAIVKSDTDAREIIQEVMLKLWVNRDMLTTVENPGGWLRTVAAHAAYDYLRKAAAYELMLARVQLVQPDAEKTIWNDFDARLVRKTIEEAMEKLPERRRQIFRMSKIEGFSRREIAERLGISENTVRNQLADAVEFVRDHLKRSAVLLLLFLFS